MLIIPREEYCETVNNVCNTQTYYERYIDYDQEVIFSSNFIPYRLVLYSGGISNANYEFEVSSGPLTTSHSFETKEMGNCDGESPPENDIWIHLKSDKFPKYEEGEELITAHYVWLYSIREESEPSPAPCSECTEDLIGTRKFATSGDFQDVMFTFYYADNQEASYAGNNMGYGVTLGVIKNVQNLQYLIDLKADYATTVVEPTTVGGCECHQTVQVSDSLYLDSTVIPILFNTPAQFYVPVDSESMSKCDISIPYQVYRQAFNTEGEITQAQVNPDLLKATLFEEDQSVMVLPLDSPNPIVLFKGHPFDLSKSYSFVVTAWDQEDNYTGISSSPIDLIFTKEILRSIYVQDPNAFPVIPGGQVQLHAETAEAVSSGDLTWEIADELPEDEAFPIDADIDPATGLLTVNPTSGHGFVVDRKSVV